MRECERLTNNVNRESERGSKRRASEQLIEVQVHRIIEQLITIFYEFDFSFMKFVFFLSKTDI